MVSTYKMYGREFIDPADILTPAPGTPLPDPNAPTPSLSSVVPNNSPYHNYSRMIFEQDKKGAPLNYEFFQNQRYTQALSGIPDSGISHPLTGELIRGAEYRKNFDTMINHYAERISDLLVEAATHKGLEVTINDVGREETVALRLRDSGMAELVMKFGPNQTVSFDMFDTILQTINETKTVNVGGIQITDSGAKLLERIGRDYDFLRENVSIDSETLKRIASSYGLQNVTKSDLESALEKAHRQLKDEIREQFRQVILDHARNFISIGSQGMANPTELTRVFSHLDPISIRLSGAYKKTNNETIKIRGDVTLPSSEIRFSIQSEPLAYQVLQHLLGNVSVPLNDDAKATLARNFAHLQAMAPIILARLAVLRRSNALGVSQQNIHVIGALDELLTKYDQYYTSVDPNQPKKGFYEWVIERFNSNDLELPSSGKRIKDLAIETVLNLLVPGMILKNEDGSEVLVYGIEKRSPGASEASTVLIFNSPYQDPLYSHTIDAIRLNNAKLGQVRQDSLNLAETGSGSVGVNFKQVPFNRDFDGLPFFSLIIPAFIPTNATNQSSSGHQLANNLRPNQGESIDAYFRRISGVTIAGMLADQNLGASADQVTNLLKFVIEDNLKATVTVGPHRLQVAEFLTGIRDIDRLASETVYFDYSLEKGWRRRP